MSEIQNYDEAVQTIKTAILQSQYNASKIVNEKQLMLYFGIGKYISLNSRNGFWGKGAIDAISERLDKELPGLRGFSARNLRYMRTFYEEWKKLDDSSVNYEKNEGSNLAHTCAKLLNECNKFEKKPHENPAIGIILCKDMNKTFVDFVIRDYSKPMGVATYKTSKDMSDELKKALPDIDDLKKLLGTDEERR